ncbi:ferrochelatase [Trueperella pecoris]|uniref:ferrochelatase n=1 Tax=Trueperella pecoris TaxID=2733571 RepID=UPI00186B950D|nr:ferrochelatase [Trueperella pecoris]QOQ39564.1 ferrochelatase [Trueperella pecoris]
MPGLLIVNLGSPESPAPEHVRTFLRDFLSDPDVVDFPRALWLPILHGIVLRVRPAKSGALYEKVWTEEGSPLVVYTRRQRDLLAQALPGWDVRYAMTYTRPSIAAQLDAFADAGTTDIRVLPLFPHWAPSSTGSIVKQIRQWEESRVHDAVRPRLRVIGAWPTQPDFIGWHAERLAEALAGAEDAVVVLSYHGVPNREVHRPQGYRAECEATTDAIARALREHGVDCPVYSTFQSKFGPGAWLQPATIDTMSELPGRGVRSVVLATPGFVADCIETLDELDVLNREAFERAGGEQFYRVPPINDHPVFARIVADLIRNS